MSPHSVCVPAIALSELRHQLRTPLNHIIGYSEILLEEHSNPVDAARLASILTEANAMLDTIQQIGGDEAGVPGAVLSRLRADTVEGIERVCQTAAELRNSMPAEYHADLDRISNAAVLLLNTLAGQTVETPAVPPSTEPQPEPRRDAFGGPGRLLVVDDSEPNRDMLSRQLLRQRHEVATAPDGETALRMLRAERFDIMLLDLMMPGMNGFDVLAAVKSDPALSGVAVILVSALDEMDSVVRSIEAGAEDYLFKPVNPTLLRARIKSTLDKLRAEEAIRRKQRLESIGLLAAGIAHDFNNILTGIIGHAQLLEQVLVSDEDREMAESIVKAGERAAELTRQLLAYSGKAMFQMRPLDLAALIAETEGLMRASLPRKARLQTQSGSAPMVIADQNQLRQVLLNLTLNAAEAIGPDCAGSVTVETGEETIEAGAHFDVMPDEVKPGRYAWVEVRDNGCGMDSATAEKIFEPFFTTKFLGRGLGLAAVAGIIRSHKGLLRVRSVPGEGSAFRLYLPVAAGAESAPIEAAEAGPFVLVVDDEPVVRQIVKLSLERRGRRVLLAESGEDALDALRRHGDRIELVLLDWKMPVMDGSEALTRLREIQPSVRVVVSSGIARPEAEAQFRDSRITGYLQKPYRMSELVNLVESLVARN